MAYLAVSFLVFILAALGMALGAILGGHPIRSGCAAVTRIEDGRIRCLLCRRACDRAARAEADRPPGRKQGGEHDAIP